MISDDYTKNWDVYKTRGPYQQKIVNVIGKYFEENNISEKIHSMLSVGHGEGDLDIPLIVNHLRGVDTYFGVEPRTTATTRIKERLNETTSTLEHDIKAEFDNDFIQSYKGPNQPIDFILLGHVMYYVVDDFFPTIERALTWLADGGHMVLSHIEPTDFFKQAEKVVLGRGLQWAHFKDAMDTCKQVLKQNGCQVQDYFVPHTMDLSGSEDDARSILNILLNTEITDSEFLRLKELITKEDKEGNKILEYGYKVTVLSRS